MSAQEFTFPHDPSPSRGVEQNLTPWVASHGGRLRRYFARRAPPDDVDDLVQDVFLRLHSVRSPGPVVNVEAYLFTVARRVLASQRRGFDVRCGAMHDPLDDVPEPANDLSPERIVAARQDWATIMAAVGELPPRARAAFQLYHFEQMSYAAIAEHMKISRDSVKELLQRAAIRVRGRERPKNISQSPRSHPPGRQSGASL
jgi:RNA polymerase sigma-70 factor (ECF subfamily)